MKAVLSLKVSLVTGKIRASMTFCSASKIRKVKIPPEVSHLPADFYVCVWVGKRQQK